MQLDQDLKVIAALFIGSHHGLRRYNYSCHYCNRHRHISLLLMLSTAFTFNYPTCHHSFPHAPARATPSLHGFQMLYRHRKRRLAEATGAVVRG